MSTVLIVLAFAFFLAAFVVALALRRSYWAALLALGLAWFALSFVLGRAAP